jgi:hypothetical protein
MVVTTASICSHDTTPSSTTTRAHTYQPDQPSNRSGHHSNHSPLKQLRCPDKLWPRHSAAIDDDILARIRVLTRQSRTSAHAAIRSVVLG